MIHLDRIPEIDPPHALVRFALSTVENVFLRPSWWEALAKAERWTLEDRINYNARPVFDVDSDLLCDDGVRAVNWRVTGIEQKRTSLGII